MATSIVLRTLLFLILINDSFTPSSSLVVSPGGPSRRVKLTSSTGTWGTAMAKAAVGGGAGEEEAGAEQQESEAESKAEAPPPPPPPRSLPHEDESWYVKTEQFCKPYPEVKPHLEAHRAWVANLRAEGRCITSGYRVDAEGKPGGGGLMMLAARSYEEAEALVWQDPLVVHGCVEWSLHGWVSEVGDFQLR